MTKENPSTVEVYQVLCEIRDYMKSMDATMLHILGLTEERLKRATTAAPASSKNVADDKELDGRYGDPEIKSKDPRDWSKESMVGRKMSECPIEYLQMLIDRYEYFNTQLGTSSEDAKKRRYNELDMAKCRGWIARKRAGWTPPAPAQTPAQSTSNPFGEDEHVDF